MKNYMNLREFADKGYLQEANRQFFHPLGLALVLNEYPDGRVEFVGILDQRSDAAGIYFDLANSPEDRVERFRDKADTVVVARQCRARTREGLFGHEIEPIPNQAKEETNQ